MQVTHVVQTHRRCSCKIITWSCREPIYRIESVWGNELEVLPTILSNQHVAEIDERLALRNYVALHLHEAYLVNTIVLRVSVRTYNNALTTSNVGQLKHLD